MYYCCLLLAVFSISGLNFRFRLSWFFVNFHLFSFFLSLGSFHLNSFFTEFSFDILILLQVSCYIIFKTSFPIWSISYQFFKECLCVYPESMTKTKQCTKNILLVLYIITHHWLWSPWQMRLLFNQMCHH